MKPVEIWTGAEPDVFCPFCGSIVYSRNGENSVCRHVIFIYRKEDRRFSYISERRRSTIADILEARDQEIDWHFIEFGFKDIKNFPLNAEAVIFSFGYNNRHDTTETYLGFDYSGG